MNFPNNESDIYILMNTRIQPRMYLDLATSQACSSSLSRYGKTPTKLELLRMRDS